MAKAVLSRVEFEYDLVAAEAKYHNDCFISFLKPITWVKVGRPQEENMNLAMEEILKYIENSDYCQFTSNELRNVCITTTVDNRTLKVRLKLRCGDKIIITEKSGTSTFICLVDNHHDIFIKLGTKKKMIKKEERLRILEAAAAIIREDIQSAESDNSNYLHQVACLKI